MRPSILIAGLSRTGVELASRLCSDWEVIAVDIDAERLESPRIVDCTVRHHGDATSAHVLEQAGAGRVQVVAAATDDDSKNLEILRVARERFAVERRLAMMRDHDWADRYRQAGVEIVDRFGACAAVLASRIAGGHRVATGIGLGRGEIIEVEVLDNSSVIGARLAELRPRRWLVGAVYREGALIVPHGDTVIQARDRVLIIGDPEILPSIATLIGAGESEFPLHYGTRLVALGRQGIEAVLNEARYLLVSTAAHGLTVQVNADEAEATERACSDGGVNAEISIASGASRVQRVAEAGDDVGILLLPPEPLSTLKRIGLGRSAIVRLLDHVAAPTLICRGSVPYERVLLVLAELPFSMHAARVAVDLVRMIDAELHLGVVHQSPLVVGAEMHQAIETKRREVVELAQMYKLSVQVEVLQGNPINEVVGRSESYDLVVLPYPRGRRSSLTRPDVGQNLLHLVRCSTLVMPVG